VDIELEATGGSHGDLASLYQWLLAEPELRGRVTLRAEPPKPGEMGFLHDALLVVLSSEAISVLVGGLTSWIARRRSERRNGTQRAEDDDSGRPDEAAPIADPAPPIILRVTRPDGGSIELSGVRLEGLTAEQLRAQIEQLMEVLLAKPDGE
jgi:hypothetical protein